MINPPDDEGSEARFAHAAPRPWRECGSERGGCTCGFIYSVPADAPIAQATIGDWGDQYISTDDGEPKIKLFAYGSVSDRCGKANAALIVAAVNAYRPARERELIEALTDLVDIFVPGGTDERTAFINARALLNRIKEEVN